MRNLAGRLNARSLGSLEEIASQWQIPISGSDPHVIVGQLYREMRDLRTGRDCWDQLDDDERAIVRVLSVSDRAAERSLTIEELAGLLDYEPEKTREIAAGLFRKGIVAREGDREALPVGESPRVFVPREIAMLFRKIHHELETGDVSGSSLEELIELLDIADIELALGIWGSEVVPGLETRESAGAHLLASIHERGRLGRVIDKLGSDATSIWEQMTSLGEDGAVPLDMVANTCGYDTTRPSGIHRLRQALQELEESLLVWHMYRDDGSRWVFVPLDISTPAVIGGFDVEVLPPPPDAHSSVSSKIAPPLSACGRLGLDHAVAGNRGSDFAAGGCTGRLSRGMARSTERTFLEPGSRWRGVRGLSSVSDRHGASRVSDRRWWAVTRLAPSRIWMEGVASAIVCQSNVTVALVVDDERDAARSSRTRFGRRRKRPVGEPAPQADRPARDARP